MILMKQNKQTVILLAIGIPPIVDLIQSVSLVLVGYTNADDIVESELEDL